MMGIVTIHRQDPHTLIECQVSSWLSTHLFKDRMPEELFKVINWLAGWMWDTVVHADRSGALGSSQK